MSSRTGSRIRMDEPWLATTRRVSWLDKAHEPGLHSAD